jgi:hypothetical protein
MKDVVVSFTIFIAMVIIMFFSVSYVNDVGTKILHESDELESLVLADNWEEADEVSSRVWEQWHASAQILPIIINHTEVDLISSEILKLTQYITSKNKEESLASTHLVRFLIENVRSLQRLNIQNIL